MRVPDEFDEAAARVAGVTPKDPMDKAAASLVDNQRTQLRSSLYGALLENPDVAARAQRLGRKTGIPSDVVSRNLPEVERNVALNEFDQVLQNSPTVAQWLADQEKAKISHDDVENLGLLESGLRFFKNTGSAGLSGLQSASSGVVGLARAPVDLLSPIFDPLAGTILPENPLRRVGEGLAEYQRGIDALAKGNMPKSDGILGSGYYSGIGSLSRNLAAIPLAIVNPQAGLIAMTAPVGGEAYGQAREEGLQPFQSVTFGASQAAIEYATEKLPVSKLIGDLKAGTPFFQMLMKQVALEVPGEQIATVLQDLNEWAVLNPEEPFSKYLEERPSAAAQTLIATIVGVGGQTTVVKGIDMAVARLTERENLALEAERDSAAIDRLNQLATASKVLQRDPESFQQFVEQAAQDGPVQDVFIDARILNQAAIDAGITLDQLPPSVQTQLGEALSTGGDVRIPLAEYAAQIAPTEYAQGLLDHIKTDPQGMSRSEAQVFMQSQSQELQAEVERVLAEKSVDDAFNASAEQVKTYFTEQLNQAGRFTPEVNTAYSSLLSNFYTVTAARAGMTPEQLLQRYPLQVQAEGVTGAAAQYDQGGKTTIFHGTSAEAAAAIEANGFDVAKSADGSIWFTSNPDIGEVAASQSGAIVKRAFDESKLKLGGWDEADKYSTDELINMGYDGLKLEDEGETTYQIFKPEKLEKVAEQLNQSAQPPRLMAINNLSADNLMFADQMGGIAVPSIGVITDQAGGVDGFGEITLLGTRDLADPRGEPVFSSDAYTARFPKPEWPKAKSKDAMAVIDSVREVAKEFDDRSLVDMTYDEMVNSPDANKVIERWVGSLAVQAMFLREQGVDVQPTVKPVRTESGLTVEQFEQLRPLFNEVRRMEQSGEPDNWLQTEQAQQLVQQTIEFLRENFKALGKRDAFIVSMERNISQNPLFFLERDLRSVERGATVDTYETSKQVRPLIDERAVEFKQWVEGKILPKFGEPFLKVGGKRVPYTLDNIVKVMTSQKVKSQEKTMTYGPGQVRAAASVQFSNIEQMREAAQQSIKDPAEYSAAKEESEKLLDTYRTAAVEFTKLRDWRGNPDTWEALDGSMRALAKWATGKKRDATSMKAALRGEDFDVARMPDDLIQQAMDAGNALLNAPVPYFEAKPQRAVQLNEFAGAVIPANASEQVREVLERNGIPFVEYTEQDQRMRVARDFAANLAAQGRATMFQGNRGQIAFGQDITQTPSVITLLKDADLSTFLHEAGHFFLEVQFDLASRIGGEAQLFGAETNTTGEQQILADTNALLKWFGVGSIEEWFAMPMEQKRSYHEQFARGFEAYLFEGKAPSIEMQGLFQRFRAWMLRVYKELKNLNVELTDEVRGVMDRMIATTEQIQLAEAGRSMMPLFTSAQQAGMTTEEFAAYQALGVDASNDAIQDLQARTLRDMAYARNARGREIKRLQKEAAGRRAEMRVEARREIMSQPVYRAWQFLTNKLSKDDRAALKAEPPRKSVAGPVDPEVDSLFVAIAKLGGLDRAQAESLWGFDKKERTPQPMFGKPLLRRENGLSVDAMGERLAQYGYLPLDENGKYDPADFEAAFDSEYRGNPVYAAAKNYADQVEKRAGEDLDLENLGAGRLELVAIKSLDIPDEIVQILVDLGMTAKDGLHPDIVVDRIPGLNEAFPTGEEMIRALAIAEDPKVAIEALTDQKMLERYGELATPEAIERAADIAIHNEARARFVATEVNAINKAAGKPKILASAAKEFAAKMIGRLQLRNLKPNQYAAAEARAAKAAQKAMVAGDTETAATEKRNQLINAYATKAAYEAQQEAQKALEFFRRVTKGSNKGLVERGRDPDVVNAARAILAAYGIAPRLERRANEYLEVLQKNDPSMYEVLRPSIEEALANAKPFQELTVEEMRGLRDEIDAMWHLSKRSRQMEVDGNMLDLEDIEDQLVAQMESIGVPDTIPGERSAITPSEAAKQGLQFAGALLRRVEQWAESMDGKFGGPFLRFVFQRVKTAADLYRADRARYRGQFVKLIESVAPSMKRGVIKAPELGYEFGRGHNGVGMAELLHAILHTGNESNKRKLLLGRGWASELPGGQLDTRRWDAFVNRMIAEGVLTKAHYDFAQGVWDLLESMKPMAQKTHRDVFGRYFDEVSADEIVTPFGIYRGGYVPAQADPRIVNDAALRKLAEQENENMAFSFPSTSKGFTKSRVEYNRPLMLDLRSLAQHIDKVLLFSYMEPAVRDVNKLLMRKGVSSRLSRIAPAAYEGMLIPWLNRAARQQVETPIVGDGRISRVLSVVRNRAGMALMFANVSNTLQQITGLPGAAVKVKPSHLMRATAQYIKAPRQMAEAVGEVSVFMRDRMANEVAAINDTMQEILLDPSLYEKAQTWTQKHAYFLQSAFDNVISPIVWTGAYNQALEQGMSEIDAIKFADGVVRQTQGTTLPEDVSRIETGPAYARLFTQFVGYFNMLANTNATELQKVHREVGLRKGAGRALSIVFFGLLAPAWIAEAIAIAMRGGPEDEDDDGYLDDWLASVIGMGTLKTTIAGVPFLGQFINAGINRFNNNPVDDRVSLSPAVSLLESAVGAPQSVYKALVEDGSKARAVKDVATAVSIATGLPTFAVARPLSYVVGVADDRIDPTGPVDVTRGLITGTASPDSRQ